MKKTHYIFKVSGYGDFPSDTLRKSSSWPVDRSNGLKAYGNSDYHTRVRTVELTSATKPEDYIWQEHGWKVTSITGGIPKDDYTLYHTWPA
jgi:hypothetical protein